ncbi:MAG: hypothetical protein QXR12_07320 [Thermofilum sp.]
MPAPVSKLFDVTLSTGRYVLYRAAFIEEMDIIPVGFTLDEAGSPVWYTGVLDEKCSRYYDSFPKRHSDFAGYSERGGAPLLWMFPGAVTNLSRWTNVDHIYFFRYGGGPACIYFRGDGYVATSSFFAPGWRVEASEASSSRAFFDGEVFFSANWTDVYWQYWLGVLKFGEGLSLEYEGRVAFPLGYQCVNLWACRRASAHSYVGLAFLVNGARTNSRVYALKRTGAPPYVEFELMYDSSGWGDVWSGAVSAYADDSCFAGVVAYNLDATWRLHTFKWRPGEPFPPPLELREVFRGHLLFAAMVSPDDYVAAYVYRDAGEGRDVLRVTGADSYTFHGDPWLEDYYRSDTEREAPWMLRVFPSGVATAMYSLVYGQLEYGHLLFYIPRDEFWAHMHRDREVRVRVGGGRLLADGCVAYADVGDKVPLAFHRDRVVLYNRGAGSLEEWVHEVRGGGVVERRLVRSVKAPFDGVLDPAAALSFPLHCGDGYSLFIASVSGSWRLARLDAESLTATFSELELPPSMVGKASFKVVGGRVHVAMGDASRLVSAVLDLETLSTLSAASVPYHADRLFAVAPVEAGGGGRRFVALAVREATAEESAVVKPWVDLVADDGARVSVEWDAASVPPVPATGDRGFWADAWWDGVRAYALVGFTQLGHYWDSGCWQCSPYPSRIMWVKWDGSRLTGGVWRELRAEGYLGEECALPRDSAFALFGRLRVDGWEKASWLVEPDPAYVYPPPAWHGEEFRPLFSCEAPFIASMDGRLQFSAPGFAAMPGSTVVGDFIYIFPYSPPPPPPKLPAARRTLTLFKGW